MKTEIIFTISVFFLRILARPGPLATSNMMTPATVAYNITPTWTFPTRPQHSSSTPVVSSTKSTKSTKSSPAERSTAKTSTQSRRKNSYKTTEKITTRCKRVTKPKAASASAHVRRLKTTFSTSSGGYKTTPAKSTKTTSEATGTIPRVTCASCSDSTGMSYNTIGATPEATYLNSTPIPRSTIANQSGITQHPIKTTPNTNSEIPNPTGTESKSPLITVGSTQMGGEEALRSASTGCTPHEPLRPISANIPAHATIPFTVHIPSLSKPAFKWEKITRRPKVWLSKAWPSKWAASRHAFQTEQDEMVTTTTQYLSIVTQPNQPTETSRTFATTSRVSQTPDASVETSREPPTQTSTTPKTFTISTYKGTTPPPSPVPMKAVSKILPPIIFPLTKMFQTSKFRSSVLTPLPTSTTLANQSPDEELEDEEDYPYRPPHSFQASSSAGTSPFWSSTTTAEGDALAFDRDDEETHYCAEDALRLAELDLDEEMEAGFEPYDEVDEADECDTQMPQDAHVHRRAVALRSLPVSSIPYFRFT